MCYNTGMKTSEKTNTRQAEHTQRYLIPKSIGGVLVTAGLLMGGYELGDKDSSQSRPVAASSTPATETSASLTPSPVPKLEPAPAPTSKVEQSAPVTTASPVEKATTAPAATAAPHSTEAPAPETATGTAVETHESGAEDDLLANCRLDANKLAEKFESMASTHEPVVAPSDDGKTTISSLSVTVPALDGGNITDKYLMKWQETNSGEVTSAEISVFQYDTTAQAPASDILYRGDFECSDAGNPSVTSSANFDGAESNSWNRTASTVAEQNAVLQEAMRVAAMAQNEQPLKEFGRSI